MFTFMLMNRNPHGIPLGIHEEYYSQHKRLLSNLLNLGTKYISCVVNHCAAELLVWAQRLN